MTDIGTLLTIFSPLFAAPLVMFTFVVVQGAGRRAGLAWFGLLTLLLGVGLGAGAIGLLFA